MIARNQLLDDETMRQFIVDGYVIIETDFSADFHRTVHSDITKKFEADGNPGNGIYESIPSLKQVYDHPAVVGALTSVLGETYAMHGHRHCHVTRPEQSEGGWHQDDVNVRHRQIRRVLAMYYPQDVTQDMGPTMILPGTQFHNLPTSRMSSFRNFRHQIPLLVKAGTVVIAHYDIWHCNLANTSTKTRYMLKFLFDRTEEPKNENPSWNADPKMREGMKERLISAGTAPYDDGSSGYKRRVLCMELWDWLYGKSVDEEETIVTHFP